MRLRGLTVLALAPTLAWLDLAVKASVRTQPWNFHERSHAWVALSVALLPCVAALAALPSRGAAASAAVLAGGGLGNLLSALQDGLWVPNPFVVGPIAFNLADVFVLLGVAGLTLSLVLLSIRYRGYLLPPRRWERALLRRLARDGRA